VPVFFTGMCTVIPVFWQKTVKTIVTKRRIYKAWKALFVPMNAMECNFLAKEENLRLIYE